MLLIIGTLFSQVQGSKSVETTTKGHKLSNKDKVEKHRKEVRQKTKKEAYPSDEVLVLVSMDSDSDSQEQIELKIQAVESVIPGTVKHHIRLSGNKHSKKRSKSHILRVQLPKGKTVKQAIAENWSRKNSNIQLVEPNYHVQSLAVPNDPRFGDMWALQNTGQSGGTPGVDIHVPETWDMTIGSSEVVVAVIDTGINYRHPELAGNMWVNPDEIPDNGIDDDGNGYIDDVYGYDFVANDGDPDDENSHGTHVAGTVGAKGNNGLGITGINWNCRLMACRFLDATGFGLISDAIEAIDYAVANGADILSNSWGWEGSASASLEAAINNARDNGVLFVAAAGNNASDNDSVSFYPASYQISNVISVAAIDHDDELAYFSNYGRNSVHVGAPGVNILSTVRNSSYAYYSGTSMAAPHVSGVAALLLSYYPQITLQEMKERILSTGDPTDALTGKTVTARCLNAYKALTTTSGITLLSPTESDSWQQNKTYAINWSSINAGDAVDVYLYKEDDIYIQLGDNIANNGILNWQVPADLPISSDYSILVDDGTNVGQNDGYFSITAPVDYSVEQFSGGSDGFDLSYKSVLFIPDDNSDYLAYIEEIDSLPAESVGSEQLILGDDDYHQVVLDSESVFLYGQSFSSFFVGSNGYITFTQGDTDYSESLYDHFETLRISGLFEDFNPNQGGTVSWQQTTESVVVTWHGVSEYGRNNASTFQIEIYFNARIRISWLSVQANTGIVGLSQGSGEPINFMESDFSSYSQILPSLITDKQVYNIGEGIFVQFSAGPGNALDWIGLYEVGNTHIFAWEYTGGVASGSVTFPNGLVDEGNYEARLFFNNSYNIEAAYQFSVEGPAVETDQVKYSSGESIEVAFSGASGNALDWIGLYEVGNTQLLAWKYTGGAASGSVTFSNGLASGNYEARLFFNNSLEVEAIDAFSVKGAPLTVETDKPVYDAHESIEVTFSGASGNAMDWIGLYEAGAGNNQYLAWKYTGGVTSGSVTLSNGLSNTGNYEARLFYNNSYNVEAAYQFDVQGITVETDKPVYAPDGNIIVDFTNASGNAMDWIGLYEAGAGNNQYLAWKYTGGVTSGSVMFPGLSSVGNYEARLFFNNSYNLEAADAFSVASTP